MVGTALNGYLGTKIRRITAEVATAIFGSNCTLESKKKKKPANSTQEAIGTAVSFIF